MTEKQRKKREKRHMRGRDKIGKKQKKRQQNVVEEKKQVWGGGGGVRVVGGGCQCVYAFIYVYACVYRR
jgi:hypothetical protein